MLAAPPPSHNLGLRSQIHSSDGRAVSGSGVGDAVRVLVADARPTRLGVRIALEGHAVICAEADTCPLAVRAACLERPQICLIGHALPGGGITAIREISQSLPETSVIMLSDRDDSTGLLPAVRAGAIGWVPASFDAQHLLRVIDAVINHEAALPRSMVSSLVNELRRLERATEEHLTVSEAEILRQLRLGHSTAAIAQALMISPVTVRRHISNLVQKVGVRDRSELAKT